MHDRHTDGVPPTAAIASEPATAGHEPTTVERGSFCTARCSCGWYGPARRSRDRARTDAAEHRAAP
ncbi:hypothetical protein GCM10015535_45210 [Streptomyces gelaticus]|uniref:Mobile element transfer n=1 Tax=Streptomyces gelaticus TaxID=285446 RepID=A0ABQ2W371_9ACTN|nr:hypothetical protein [Streptomyces gelaticus]GGV90059.1 hypothetical protein GCM10015535_45210 [Streptomyces gelaticus]